MGKGPVAAPVPQGPTLLGDELSRIGEALAQGIEELSRLEARLDGVAYPEPPADIGAKDNAVMGPYLVGRATNTADLAEGLVERIERLTNRIQL